MTKKLTFCSMLAVLGVLSILLSNILTSNTVFFYLFSTVFCYIATEEYGIRYGLITYAAITLLGFLLSANKISMAAYALIVGYYPILKHLIEHKLIKKPLRWLVKLLGISVIAGIASAALSPFLNLSASLYLLYPMGLVIFILYDIALEIAIKFYVVRLRKFKP